MYKILFKSSVIMLALTGLFISVIAQKTDLTKKYGKYYLSPNGDDGAPGTFSQPWRTLEKANASLQPGDTAIFFDGTYSGNISPVSSGENSQTTITYMSLNPYGATLTGREGSNYVVIVDDRHFVTIDGFRMIPDGGGFGLITNSSFITLQNCHMEHSKNRSPSLHFINSHYNRVLNNVMTRLIDRTPDSKIYGDGCRFTDSGHNLVEGNSFSKMGHSPLNFRAYSSKLCSHNIVRNNCFHNGWGRNFEVFNADRCLFENNIISDAFNGAKSAGSASQPFFYNSIFRNNLIYDNWDGVIVTNSWAAMLGGPDPVTLEFVNSRIYNNTFANNPSTVWVFATNKSDPLVRSNKFINNLFYRNGFRGDFAPVILGPGVTDDNIFHNNLIYGEEAGQGSFGIMGSFYTAEGLNREFPKQFKNNIDVNPLFQNFKNRSFILRKGSPAIDAGRPHAIVVRSGSGREMPVDDACFFFDGFGIDGEEGDIVHVGKAGRIARVIHADIENNILTLDRNLTWKADDPVSLPYSGKSPDIGALQHGNTGTLTIFPMADPVVVNPGKEVTFSSMITGKKGKIKMEWNLGDGTISYADAPVHAYRDVGDYVVRVRCSDVSGTVAQSALIVRVQPVFNPSKSLMQTGFEEEDFEEWGHLWDRGPSRGRFTYYPEAREDGKGQCMCVSAQEGNTMLATNVKLREWNIDTHPVVKFSYRIPPGVPVGVWLRPWVKDGRPENVCMGGSPANSSGKYVNLENFKLTDDGEWHTIVFDAREIRKAIPGLEFLHSFEFITYGQSQEDHKFWFDDFSIAPR